MAIDGALALLPKIRDRIERSWRAADRTMLRLQGRLDTPSYDRWLPYGFATVYAIALILLALVRLHTLRMGGDTAKFSQAVWQLSEGFKPITTLSGGNIIGEQGSLVLYPLGALASIFPPAETLLVAKSLALALTMIPLWRLARGHGRLGVGASSAVMFVWAIYSAVHAMNAADFQPAIIAVPALMWAVLLGLDERYELTAVAVIIVMCCRSDLGLAVVGLGLLLLRERRTRVGWTVIALGAVWFLAAMLGVQPWLSDDTYSFLAPYARFGDTPFGIVWGLITNPIDFLKILGSEANFGRLVYLLAPVLFLPLTAPRFLLPAVPLFVLYMGAEVPDGRLREAGQFVPVTVFIFVATVFALRQAGRTLVNRVRVERRVILALVLTSLVFFVNDSATSPYNEPWEWRTRTDNDLARIATVAQIPDDEVRVRASTTFLPLLSDRLGIYELDTDVDEYLLDSTGILDAATSDVDWVFFDRNVEGLSDLLLEGYRTSMQQRGWRLVERNDDANYDVYQFTGVIEATIVQPIDDTDLIDLEPVGDATAGSDDGPVPVTPGIATDTAGS